MLEHVTQEDTQDCADALNAAGATAYVKLMHGKLLPYEYGFENNNLDEEGWSLVDCDVQTKPDIYDSHTGDYSFRFYSNTNPPQYLISPELVGGTEMSVSFWYKIGNINKPETFQVGFSTTTDDINAFKWGDEITARDIFFQKYKNIFPAGTKYVAVRYNSNNKAALLLDDFKIKSYEAPAPKSLPYEYGFENNDLDEEEWSLVNSVTNSIIIDGSSYSFSGDYSFRFSHSTNPPQYLISPELKCNAEMRVSFQYRITNLNLLETFQVGYSTTTDDINAFTWGDEITASYLFWMKYLNTFPEGTKYVAVRHNSNDKASLILDDFKFFELLPKTLPYEYGFENNYLDEEGWSLFNCATQSSIKSSEQHIYSGNYGFDFHYNRNPPQYLISAELVGSTEMRVSFWYRAGKFGKPETFQVGYSTTTRDVSAFTWGDEITASGTQWTQYQNTFPAGTKYVAVRYTSNNVAELSLDDFSFTKAAGMKGDVNLDGSVDISDVVQMVNYILGDNSLVNVPLYGDMNDDSSVDISDVVALVNIILGGS